MHIAYRILGSPQLAWTLIRSNDARRVFGLLSLLFTGTMLSSAFVFLAQMLLARLLPIGDFGRLAALLAAVNFFTPFGSAGVNWFLLRVFAQESCRAARWLGPSSWLIGLSSCGAAIGLSVYAIYGLGVLVSQPMIAALTCIAMLFGQIGVELGSCLYQLEDRYAGLAVWQNSTQAGRLAVLLVVGLASIVLKSVPGLEYVLIGYALVGALTAYRAIVLLSNLRTGSIHLPGYEGTPESGLDTTREPSPSIFGTIFEAGPYALVTMFYVLSGQGIVVIIEWLRGGAGAGFFAAAFSVYAATALIPNVVYMKFLASRICRWAAYDRKRFQAVFHIGAVAMLALGLLFMLVTSLSAHWLMPLLFGARFARSASVLMILSAAIPLRFVQHAYSALFVSREDTARKVPYLGLAALAGVAASIALVPPFDVEGAAVAAVIAEAVLLALHVHGTARFIGGIFVRDTFRIRTFRTSLRQIIDPEKP